MSHFEKREKKIARARYEKSACPALGKQMPKYQQKKYSRFTWPSMNRLKQFHKPFSFLRRYSITKFKIHESK